MLAGIERRLARLGPVTRRDGRCEKTDGSFSIHARTPPPSYVEEELNVDGSLHDRESTLEDPAPLDMTRTLSSLSHGTPRKPLVREGDASGVDWRAAEQGLSMLSLASAEATCDPSAETSRPTSQSSTSSRPTTARPSLSRQMYIHAVTYLLQGLPSDLQPHESLGLRAALPSSLAPAPISARADQSLTLAAGAVRPEPAHSLLHRAIASTMIHLAVVLALVLPWVRLALARALQYEQEHRVAQRMGRRALGAAGELQRRAMDVASAAARGGEDARRVEGELGRVAAWCVRGVVGGVYEGFEGGLRVLDERGGLR